MKLNADCGLQGWRFFFAIALIFGCCSHAGLVAVEDEHIKNISLEVPGNHELSLSNTKQYYKRSLKGSLNSQCRAEVSAEGNDLRVRSTEEQGIVSGVWSSSIYISWTSCSNFLSRLSQILTSKRFLLLAGQKDGVCESKGGQFPKFSLEGHPPQKASKGSIDLTLCRYYRKKTCCDIVQIHAAILSLQRLATSGEASKECLEKWEVLECSICDPRVGVTPGPPLLCPSFCESLYSACSGAFFSTEPLTQILMPCGPKDVLCAKAYEWASNGSTFCELAGYSVMDNLNALAERHCFDGRIELAKIFPDDVDNKQRIPRRNRHYNILDTLKNWTKNMNIAAQIMWAIGGLVLTAGFWHLRQRTLVRRNAAATVLRNKLLYEEARARQQAMYKGSGPRTRSETRQSTKTG